MLKIMSTNQLNVELLLLEVETLFERFRGLPQDARAIILAKIRIKLLEEFKDFLIHESDINQESVIEISYENVSESNNVKENNIIELPVELTEKIENICDSASIINSRGNFFPIESTSNGTNKIVFPHGTVAPADFFPNEDSVREPPLSSNIRFICNYCGKQYEKKNLFKKHIKRHKNSRKYECATCSLRFNTKEDLIKHFKIHSEKSFKCLVCSKQLANNTVLRNHTRVMHEKEEKYFCEKCDYFTYSNHTLKEHNRLKHNKNFKKYACAVCNSVFNAKVFLKEHLRSHTGEKPYKCNLCTAAFICSGRLTNHMNSVHGEKKFPCEVCDKSFKTTHKLKRHFFIHTKIKPYGCPFCNNYASNTQGNLTKHVRTVHQMNDFSYLKYKKMLLGETQEVKEEWIKNAESFTNEYLKNLSNSDNKLTVIGLREQHLEKKKKKIVHIKNNQDIMDELNIIEHNDKEINFLL